MASTRATDIAVGLTGVVFPFAGIAAPTGFLLCDGTAISRTTYASLFNVISLQKTGDTTNASAVITAVASTANVSVGMPISGPGIPAATTVLSFVADTSITMSANATATASGVAIVIAPFGVGDGSTTFNVPDLRGEFIRGLDNGRGVDTSRALGTFQRGTLVSADDVADDGSAIGAPGIVAVAGPVAVNGDVPQTDDWYGRQYNFSAVGSNVAYSGVGNSAVTRPRNVALNHIIKT